MNVDVWIWGQWLSALFPCAGTFSLLPGDTIMVMGHHHDHGSFEQR